MTRIKVRHVTATISKSFCRRPVSQPNLLLPQNSQTNATTRDGRVRWEHGLIKNHGYHQLIQPAMRSHYPKGQTTATNKGFVFQNQPTIFVLLSQLSSSADAEENFCL